jgi:serine/threonine-protein kinase
VIFEPVVPKRIGPYDVTRLLGAGGMGQVYLAHHRHLGRDAAIKVLLPQIFPDESVIARFFGEARATAQLRHPNIVEVFDCDVLPDGRAYIVMEHLRGESLRKTLDRLRRLAPDYVSVAAIAGMMADALHAAHSSGIVHRDLKPDNAYLAVLPNASDQITVKILDFGIAKLVAAGDLRRGTTRTGALLGTPMYMSPEQCRGVPTVGHRSDVYSLGCVVFELISGRPPFVAEAPGDLLLSHMTEEPPALSMFDPDVPAVIEDLVGQMLRKEPSARPRSMSEVAQTLASFIGIGVADLRFALKRPSGFEASPGAAVSAPASSPAPTTVPEAATPTALPNCGLARSVAADNPATTPPPVVTTDSPIPASTTENGGSGQGTTAARPAPTSWTLLAAIPFALALVGGVAYVALRSGHGDSSTKPEPIAPDVPALAPNPTAPAEVEFVVTSVPVPAQIWIAGEAAPRGSTPWRAILPRSEASLGITLKADGFVDKTVHVDATRGRNLELVLEAAPAAPQPAASRPTPAHRRERAQIRRKVLSAPKYEAMED